MCVGLFFSDTRKKKDNINKNTEPIPPSRWHFSPLGTKTRGTRVLTSSQGDRGPREEDKKYKKSAKKKNTPMLTKLGKSVVGEGPGLFGFRLLFVYRV